jgi:hypothetical protein
MKLAVGALFVAIVGLLALPAPAAAFHGSPYRADGTASIVILGTEHTFAATLWWLGNGPLLVGNYKIELRTLDTNMLVHVNQFGGVERFTNLFFTESQDCAFHPNGLLEVLDYEGIGSAVLSGDILHITGWQHNDLCTGTQSMHYEGTYLNSFQLDLDVWAHI